MGRRAPGRRWAFGLSLVGVLWSGPWAVRAGEAPDLPAPRARAELRSLMSYAVNDKRQPDFLTDHATDTLSWTRARLLLDWAPGPRVRAELQAGQDLIFSTYGIVDCTTVQDVMDTYPSGQTAWLNRPNCGLVPGLRPDQTVLGFSRPDAIYRLADARWRWERTENLQAVLWLDKLDLRFELAGASLTIGRQAIDLGGAWLWSPLDVFEPFDPRVVDQDHRNGVDAVRLQVPLGGGVSGEIIGAAGRGGPGELEPPLVGLSWYGSALLARVSARLGGWSLAVQGGKVNVGYLAGGEVEAGFGLLRVKGEGAYYVAANKDMLEDYASASAGIGLGPMAGLDVDLEYLYNGAGEANGGASWPYKSACSRALHAATHMLGARLRWESASGFRASLLALAAPVDKTGWLQPAIVFHASERIDLRAGAMISLGSSLQVNLTTSNGFDPGSQLVRVAIRKNDLGDYPTTFFLELDLRTD